MFYKPKIYNDYLKYILIEISNFNDQMVNEIIIIIYYTFRKTHNT